MTNVYDTEKVLFVNSDIEYIEEIREPLLEKFQIMFATSGEEALSLLDAGYNFAVIVADINLPVSDNREFVNSVSDLVPDSVKIIVSDFSDVNTLIDVINHSNIYCFIKKNMPLQSLMEVIDGAIKTYHLAILEKKINKKLRKEIKQKEKVEQELRQTNEELKKFAFKDDLTDLGNRRYTRDAAIKEVERTRRYGESLSFLMVDLDHFKKINDTYGHSAGDSVLVEVAHRLKKNLRLSDLAGRIGGEEFLIMLPETDLKGAELVANKLLAEISGEPVKEVDLEIQVTCSIGVAELHVENETYDEIVKRVDSALYEAKRTGRNRVSLSKFNQSSIA